MAMASVSCASRDSEPSDIAPVTKRLTISAAGSISSSASHWSSGSSLNVSSPHRVLEQRDRLRVPHVVLALAPPGVHAAHRQQVLGGEAEPAGVALQGLDRQHLGADA